MKSVFYKVSHEGLKTILFHNLDESLGTLDEFTPFLI